MIEIRFWCLSWFVFECIGIPECVEFDIGFRVKKVSGCESLYCVEQF